MWRLVAASPRYWIAGRRDDLVCDDVVEHFAQREVANAKSEITGAGSFICHRIIRVTVAGETAIPCPPASSGVSSSPLRRTIPNVATSASVAHFERVRDLFEDIFSSEPIDPVAAARRAVRRQLHRRFYASVGIDEYPGGYAIALDGRAIRTPARRRLVAPVRALAEALASEWNAQAEFIDPAHMPLTRLANTIIDGVADHPSAVAAEVGKYLVYDLVCYRAEGPDRLVARQAAAWDPVLSWAQAALGANFIPKYGLAVGGQPRPARAAAGSAIPCEPPYDPWRLGSLHAATTLTGSALIALALASGALCLEAAWTAAHVDEDWNMEVWGRDELALERRAFRFAEMRAADLVLRAGRANASAISS